MSRKRPGFSDDGRVGPWVTLLRNDSDFTARYVEQDAARYQTIVEGMSRLLFDRDTVPAETNVLRSNDLTRGGTLVAPNAVRALNEEVGGVNVDSASGNPYQPTIFYHGFQASALQGTPQGLAVYVNGVRFNQAFGDTVNFDLLPDLAIYQMNLEGSNPVFGLNALGATRSHSRPPPTTTISCNA